MSTKSPLLPIIALLYGATFWGALWYPLRLLEAEGLSGSWQMLVSYTAAVAVFVPFARFHAAPIKAHWGALTILAFASGWTNIAFVLAMLDGTVVRVLLLFYLSPLWQTLLARWLLDEQIDRRTVLTLTVGLAGAFVMLWDEDLGSAGLLDRSDCLALSAGFSFALNNVMARRIQGVNVGTKTFFAWLGVVILALCMIVPGGAALPQATSVAWIGAVVLGVLGFLFSTLFVVYGVSHMPAQRSAVIMLFEIVVGALTAWWLASESLVAQEWVGGLLIVGAGVVAATRQYTPNPGRAER